MKYVIDIETIPQPLEERLYATPTEETVKYGNTKDPEKRQKILDAAIDDWAEGSDCALHAQFGRIAMIGLRVEGEDLIFEIGKNSPAHEYDMIGTFFEAVGKFSTSDLMIGHNIKRFDIPYIIRRSSILGIRHKTLGMMKAEVDAYKPPYWMRDTMLMWAAGDRQTYIKLEILAQALHIPVNSQSCSGSLFYHYFENNRESCREYLKQDLRLTDECYEKLKI